MTVHSIWDFTFLYYKYYFAMKQGNLKRLTHAVDWKGSVIEKDMSIIYYAIAEIEKQRRMLEEKGFEVISSICFDMPSDRTELEGGEAYKEGRKSTLKEEDFEDMGLIEKMLGEAGHNTYRLKGYEADDLVTYIANKYKDRFDFTVIYTPDKDLAVNIDDKISLNRYKSNSGYRFVNVNNYENYFSDEFDCTIKYNSILLFLSTVGDKSDKIKGIPKFGPKAFDKLVASLDKEGVNWDKCNDLEYLEEVMKLAEKYLKPEQVEEMYKSYNLVKPKGIEDTSIIKEPVKKVSYELRYEAYIPYNFISLLK